MRTKAPHDPHLPIADDFHFRLVIWQRSKAHSRMQLCVWRNVATGCIYKYVCVCISHFIFQNITTRLFVHSCTIIHTQVEVKNVPKANCMESPVAHREVVPVPTCVCITQVPLKHLRRQTSQWCLAPWFAVSGCTLVHVGWWGASNVDHDVAT